MLLHIHHFLLPTYYLSLPYVYTFSVRCGAANNCGFLGAWMISALLILRYDTTCHIRYQIHEIDEIDEINEILEILEIHEIHEVESWSSFC
ncbi:hypothetical protein EYC84_008338 [Monilinia fructicola]|uniref:Uncharacterized protein n=1 Tax=Monilinia fructicola TaxID=38448 RepID=A0A5M9JF05_MONFR|nr:hypothetical protein EYC84_008338 [Monilinia fructicola]